MRAPFTYIYQNGYTRHPHAPLVVIRVVSLVEHQTGKRRSVVAAREKQGRTRTIVVEHEADGVEPIAKVIEPGSTVHSYEVSRSWKGYWQRASA